MTEDLILRHDQGAIATLTLNRPTALNALSDTMIAALTDALDRIATDRTIRVIILRGAGRAFCAGHDLKEMQAARAQPDKGAAAFADFLPALWRRAGHGGAGIGVGVEVHEIDRERMRAAMVWLNDRSRAA